MSGPRAAEDRAYLNGHFLAFSIRASAQLGARAERNRLQPRRWRYSSRPDTQKSGSETGLTIPPALCAHVAVKLRGVRRFGPM